MAYLISKQFQCVFGRDAQAVVISNEDGELRCPVILIVLRLFFVSLDFAVQLVFIRQQIQQRMEDKQATNCLPDMHLLMLQQTLVSAVLRPNKDEWATGTTC